MLRIGSLCAKLCHNTYLTGVEAVMYTVYKTIVFLKLLAFFVQYAETLPGKSDPAARGLRRPACQQRL